MSKIEDRILELRGFFDQWDAVILLILAIIIGLFFLPSTVSIGGFSLSLPQYSFSPIVALTALSVFFGSKIVRNGGSSNSEIQTVRRYFDSGDFGLKNYGPGPALDLRVHATIEPEGPEHTIEQSDELLHLEEGEFLSVLKGDLAELRNPDSELFEREDATRIELYYTWESPSGRQRPTSLTNPREMTVDELVREAKDPRSEELDILQKKLRKESEVIQKPTL